MRRRARWSRWQSWRTCRPSSSRWAGCRVRRLRRLLGCSFSPRALCSPREIKNSLRFAILIAAFGQDESLHEKPASLRPSTRIVHLLQTYAGHCSFVDLRRALAAAVPRSTAMALSGHLTESVYRRYALVDSGMLGEGVKKLAEWAGGQPSRTNVHSFFIPEAKKS